MKIIVFYPHEEPYDPYVSPYDYNGALTTFSATEWAIEHGDGFIETTQMCFLSTDLLEKGYTIWIEKRNDHYAHTTIEMIDGEIHCDSTNRQLTMASNLFKLWLAGEFDE